MPTLRICFSTGQAGRKSDRRTEMPLFRRAMTVRAMTTLMVWDRVVPRAAPEGPRPRAPMKR